MRMFAGNQTYPLLGSSQLFSLETLLLVGHDESLERLAMD